MTPADPFVSTDPAAVAIRDARVNSPAMSKGVSSGDCLQGRFVIEEELGRGNGGTVFMARDRVLDRPVAIKILSRPADPEALARFAQEARAAGALEHPNVLVVHDVGVDRGTPFIVSELLRGRTLRTRLADGPLQPNEALSLALQLARGLSAAHRRGIVHRDLKPENLFLVEHGGLKILDFGVAKLLPHAAVGSAVAVPTASGTFLGTVPYMSPEQVRGRPADARSDVFAFGVILHEMLSGSPPFTGPSDVEIGHAILRDEPPPLPAGTPQPLVAITGRCLAKNPEDRFASAAELVDVLERLAPEPAPLLNRRRMLSLAGTIAVILAVTLARQFGFLPAPHAATAVPTMLAVLPFRVLGANADREAVCAGLAEILTNKLLQMEHLHRSLNVVSASDVLREKVGSARDARNAFGATHALSGTVQWSADHIAFTTNLVDTTTQTVVEARDFEVPADDVAGAGRLLVQKVAEMLELAGRPELQGGAADAFSTSSAASALYLQGRGYLQRYDRVENIDRALEAFDRALEKDPAFALAHAGRAEAWLRRDRIIRDPSSVAQARASARRAVELGGNLAQVEVTAGLVQLAAGEYSKAIETFKLALQIEPANADALRELGNAYDSAGNIADAEATFRRAVQFRPDSWAAIRDLGVFYNKHGRLQDALAVFQRVIAVAPDSYVSYGNLGGIYIRMGRYDEAAAALQKSLALRPTMKGFMNLGSVHYFSGRFAEASDAYRKATQLTPSDERAWGALADALRWVPGNADEVAGAYREAIALAEQQTTLNPKNAELRSRLAMYHAYAGDRGAADAELKEALRLDPRDATVLFRAALVHEQLGRRDFALQSIDQSLKAGGTREEISKAPALAALREDARYAAILSR